MKMAGFTRQERTFLAYMRVLALLFSGAAVLFAALPDYLPTYITRIGEGLFGWHDPSLPPEAGRFWNVLAVALLASLAYLSAIVQRDLVRNIGYARPIILAKFVSAAGFLLCFWTSDGPFLYLVGAIVDGILCVLTWQLYTRAVQSRN